MILFSCGVFDMAGEIDGHGLCTEVELRQTECGLARHALLR